MSGHPESVCSSYRGLCLCPAEYGGLGLDFSYNVAVSEELGNIRCGGVPMAIGVQTDMATPALARWNPTYTTSCSWAQKQSAGIHPRFPSNLPQQFRLVTWLCVSERCVWTPGSQIFLHRCLFLSVQQQLFSGSGNNSGSVFSLFTAPLEPLVSVLEHLFKHPCYREAWIILRWEEVAHIAAPGNSCHSVYHAHNYNVLWKQVFNIKPCSNCGRSTFISGVLLSVWSDSAAKSAPFFLPILVSLA